MRALVTNKHDDGAVVSRVEAIEAARLPEGDVRVAVEWSGLNYKDALCLNGLGNLVRAYPHVGGIDFSGRVIESGSSRFQPGQAVVLTGWRVGETHWGGYAEQARVKGDWLVPLPGGLTSREAMVLGTAGLSAMLAVNRLEAAGLAPERGPVLVTGAGGGVGSLAVAILARLGYRVGALTGRPELGERLRALGATDIVARESLLADSGKVLDKETYAGAVDNVGGEVLAQTLKKIVQGGAVAAIGLAGGADFRGNVMPFILRDVSLIGVNSVTVPTPARVEAWARLARLFPGDVYAGMVAEHRLEDLPALSTSMLKGGVAGRVIVSPGASAS